MSATGEYAVRLRELAEVQDVPLERRMKVAPSNDRERELVRAARAFGLRWAAEVVEEMADR